MDVLEQKRIDLLEIGNAYQLAGAVYTGNGRCLLVPFPDEDPGEFQVEHELLEMNAPEWEQFLRQTDLLDVQGPNKAILRKSQRQIDQNVAWAVYRRDQYACRYCGRNNVPLTVDHVILWEEGGPSIEENLLSACRRCNKLRGNMQYVDWLVSNAYKSVSGNLTSSVAWYNKYDQVSKIEAVKGQLVAKQRSR